LFFSKLRRVLTRLQLERGQVLVYLAAIALGATLGWNVPATAPVLDKLLWPVLAALLYVTFAQVPLLELRGMIGHGRFLAALLVVNFIVVPPLAWLLARFLPPDPVVLLGVYLVLLAPCTDWFVSFTLLGKGDGRLAIAATPVLLLSQMLLLPAWLWLFLGGELAGVIRAGKFLEAFLGLIVLPLALVAVTEAAARRSRLCARWLQFTAWLPVPLLAVTVLVIAGAQIRAVSGSWRLLGATAAVFLAYAAIVPFLARFVARRVGLATAGQRTIIFSAGTRNSFVVLPLALALPAGWELTAAIIVLQSLIELAAMIAYLWWIPACLVVADISTGNHDHPPPVHQAGAQEYPARIRLRGPVAIGARRARTPPSNPLTWRSGGTTSAKLPKRSARVAAPSASSRRTSSSRSPCPATRASGWRFLRTPARRWS
jgi:arsenite transporter